MKPIRNLSAIKLRYILPKEVSNTSLRVYSKVRFFRDSDYKRALAMYPDRLPKSETEVIR